MPSPIQETSTETSPGRLPTLAQREFRRDGYYVARGWLTAEVVALRATILANLEPLLGPAEFESDVGYPGAPRPGGEGAETPRRLLHAMTRSSLVQQIACGQRVGAPVAQLLETSQLRVSQCHHNCFMTKHPGFSSSTAWHQDIRYWSFDRPELVSAWVALTPENARNGGLLVLPGTHELALGRGRLDADLFLRPDLAENAVLIESARQIQLEPGDVLFFHSRLFHAAGMNQDEQVKLSLVFTYHAADNRPIPGTRSANYPSLRVTI